ncbi:MAG: DEAD/DEAH box helicase [Winogradskyella sp.]|nr:DEAD/DEAH box helicase [Winogradskyella sp.]
MSFKDLSLIKPLLKALDTLGYIEPTLIQEKTIPAVLNKKDVIASAQTGTGKTAAFALPILQLLIDYQDVPKHKKTIKSLVVSPTRELAVQINDNFKAYGKYTNLRSMVIFGGTSIEPQLDLLKKGADILVATPGRLLDLHKQDLINLDYVEILVLDEADLMLDMGFIDDVRKIERLCRNKKQSLLFSATIPAKVEDLAKSILNQPERIDVSTSTIIPPSLEMSLYYVSKRNKMKLCLHLLRNHIKGNVLIFRRTKFGVDKLEQKLLEHKYKVDSIHGNKDQSQRQTALNKFKSGYVSILIATDVASRGIDIDELDVVINFDLPNVPETFVHRIGRTARAGQSGKVISLCSPDEKNYIKSIERFLNTPLQIVDDQPYPLDPKAKPEVHKKKGSKYKKGRKSVASKKKKKRWY